MSFPCSSEMITSHLPSILRGSRIVPIIPLKIPAFLYLSVSQITLTLSNSFICFFVSEDNDHDRMLY